MKKPILWILALVLLVLPAACCAEESGNDPAELFYEYLKENVIPETGICSGASFTTVLENKDMTGHTGLLCALTDDLDQDGSPEMVTVSVIEEDIVGTVGGLVFKSGTCVSAVLDLYELVDGQVVHADGPVTAAVMEPDGYGYIRIDAARWDGFTYFRGISSQDNNTTSGVSQRTLFHPEDGKLVFDYVSSGGWGMSLPVEDANELMGTRNMDIRYTTFSFNDGNSISEALCNITFSQDVYQSVTVSMTDETFLANILESGYTAFSGQLQAKLAVLDENEERAKALVEEELQKLAAAEDSPAKNAALAEFEYLKEATGFSFEMVSESLPDDGSYSVLYSIPGQDNARVRINTDASGTITLLHASAGTFQQTAEWIAVKDALLRSPALALSDDVISAFSGTLSTNSFDDILDGYEFWIMNLDNYTINIKKP